MMDYLIDYPGVFLGLIFIILIGLCFLAHRSDVQFAAEMNTKMQECLKAGETEYTCKAYINSLEAKRSAETAAVTAGVAVGMAGASIGVHAGR